MLIQDQECELDPTDTESTLSTPSSPPLLSPQPLTLSCLPIEIHLKIIDLLPVKSVMSLRAVDKQFRELVDAYEKVWRDKLAYRLDLDKLAKNNSSVSLASALESFELFLNRIAFIRVFDVKCENVLPRDKKIELNLRHRKNGGALRTDRTYTVRTRDLNIASTVNFLNLISTSCSKLIIESFFKSNPRQRSFNKSENQRCHSFEYLTCLDLNCATFSQHLDGSLKQEFRNINNICVDQLVELFPNLAHLHLQHYNDSVYKLYQKLASLPRLKLVEFHQVSTHAHFNLNWELQVFEKNQDHPYTPIKLKVETYIFRSTQFETIQLYLAHFSDPSYITSLSLFRIELTKVSFNYLLRLISARMPNLRTLSSDMLQGKYVDELTMSESFELGLLDALMARLTRIYLWDCDAHIYEVANVGEGDCGVKLKRRNRFSSYDYSFSLFDFGRLFGTGGDKQLLWFNAHTVVISFAQTCFCDAAVMREVNETTDSVLKMCRNAKSIELRFKCTHCNKQFVKYFNNFWGQ